MLGRSPLKAFLWIKNAQRLWSESVGNPVSVSVVQTLVSVGCGLPFYICSLLN